MKALLDNLARLASLAYQMRFIVNGTRNEYVLPPNRGAQDSS
jgi:hypothetical protein